MDELETLLTKIGIEFRSVQHPAVYTVEESMVHSPDAVPVKNLLLTVEKGSRYFLVVMKGDERLDMKLLASQLLAKKLRFAKADAMLQKLAVSPGSASLFCLLNSGSEGVEVVIDRRLIHTAEVGFHPFINTSTVYISGSDITKFLTSIKRRYQIFDL